MDHTTSSTCTLRAGAAQVDITPTLGTQIEGDIGRYRPATFVQDPLYAKALVLESAGRKLCLLSMDLLAITGEWADRIRQRAAIEFGFDMDAVMVHDTQTHSAPSLGHFMISGDCPLIPTDIPWARSGDDAYSAWAVERIMEAVRQAHESLQPALIGAAGGVDGRVAFNRRFVMRDGKVRTNAPIGDPNIRHVEGPMDPEVGVVCVTTEQLHPISLLLHHTCHPAHGYPHRNITADWPGAWSDQVRQAYRSDIVPLVLNGWCGNINHPNPLDPHWVNDQHRMGRLLAETTDTVLRRITYTNQVSLDWRSCHLQIPIRTLSDEVMGKARRMLEEHPVPIWLDEAHTRIDWDWMYAVATLDLYEHTCLNPLFDYEVQVIRIGDIALVAVPGEPFVEGQLEIKLKSPTYPTYVVHHCHSYVGYVPTREAFARGGYETWTANWSRLAPEALEMIVAAALETLHQVFAAGEAS
ncbi:MAG: hypothetical protein ACYC5M_00835 [Anaerolineae bacterium]